MENNVCIFIEENLKKSEINLIYKKLKSNE